MSRPTVLALHQRVAPFIGALQEHFTVLNAWSEVPAEAAATIEAAVALAGASVDTAQLDALPALKLIACFGAGYGGIDLDWVKARGIVVTHTGGLSQQDVADHALGMIIGVRRRLIEGDRLVRGGDWSKGQSLRTQSLRGQKLGVMGLGRIGTELARRADVLGMNVAWWGPRPKPDAVWPQCETLLELARWAEILAVTSRADSTNANLISAEIIGALGPNGLLVNVARGQLVDEEALITALKRGEVGAAALDVYQEEPTSAQRWADVPNTLLTPHTSGATDQIIKGMFDLLIANLRAVLLEKQPPITPVPN